MSDSYYEREAQKAEARGDADLAALLRIAEQQQRLLRGASGGAGTVGIGRSASVVPFVRGASGPSLRDLHLPPSRQVSAADAARAMSEMARLASRSGQARRQEGGGTSMLAETIRHVHGDSIPYRPPPRRRPPAYFGLRALLRRLFMTKVPPPTEGGDSE